jgi:hypothetical protein
LFARLSAAALLVAFTACSKPNYWSGSDQPFGTSTDAPPAAYDGSGGLVGGPGQADAGGSSGTGGGAGGTDGGGPATAPDAHGPPAPDAARPATDVPGSRPDGAAADAGAPVKRDAAPDRPPGWSGKTGRMRITESPPFDLGSGKLSWSIASGQQGYFYSGTGYTTPEATIASVSRTSSCSPMYSGYVGLTSVQQLEDAASLTYSVARPNVSFGSRKDPCNMGLLVFKQNGQYGVIDFLSVEPGAELSFDYWLADPGVTDFSNAP